MKPSPDQYQQPRSQFQRLEETTKECSRCSIPLKSVIFSPAVLTYSRMGSNNFVFPLQNSFIAPCCCFLTLNPAVVFEGPTSMHAVHDYIILRPKSVIGIETLFLNRGLKCLLSSYNFKLSDTVLLTISVNN